MTVFLKWAIFSAVRQKIRICGNAIAESGMKV
jgi:hypothetical protein